VPYYGYARQDRKDEGRVPITAKLVANIITRAGADRVLAMDLHAAQIQGFFDVPVDHLYAAPVLNEYFVERHYDPKQVVVVSPDEGSIKRALGHAERLGAPLAIVDKRRADAEHTKQENIIGAPVSGKIALMFDDMISTAGSICGAAQVIHDRAAGRSSGSSHRPSAKWSLPTLFPCGLSNRCPRSKCSAWHRFSEKPSSASTATSRSAGCSIDDTADGWSILATRWTSVLSVQGAGAVECHPTRQAQADR
jgi:hypothetical protein